MKRLFFALFLMAVGIPAFAQQPTGTISRTLPLSFPFGPMVSGQTQCTAPGFLYPFPTSKVTYTFPSGTPNAVTITVTGSTNGRTFSTVDTGTSTTGGTINAPAVYESLCVTATTLTGAGVTVAGAIQGVSDIGSVSVDPAGIATSTNQTNGDQKSQICDAGGDCATVTGSKLDVNATISTTGLATSTIQTDGTQKTQIVDGSGNVIGATSNKLDVDLKSGAVASGALASGSIASGAVASGAYASGSIASGAIASGAVAAGAIASGAAVSGAFADGSLVTLGAKADAKNAATDTTAITLMSVEKQISEYLKQITAGTATASVTDPCSGLNKTSVPINIHAATTTVLAAASSSNKLYGCELFLQSSGTLNVELVEDASGSCASPDAGLLGGTADGTGQVITSGAGSFTLGNGNGTVFKTASTNVNVCLITSANPQISGVLTYVLAP